MIQLELEAQFVVVAAADEISSFIFSDKKQRYLEFLCSECSGGLSDEIVASLLLGVALGKGHMGRLNKCSFSGKLNISKFLH